MKTGVLLVNLGTPDSYEVKDVRKYLREFLSDPRVIDVSPLSRWMLVNFIIAPIRSPRSARLYKKVWTKDGSPLMHYSNLQQKLLQQLLGDNYQVELAMRYQNPSIESALVKFNRSSVSKIIVFPLFPQYASASTGSVHEKVMDIVSRWQVIPEIKFIGNFFDNDEFLEAFAEKGRKYSLEEYDHFLFSFHGLPERQILKADKNQHCLRNGCCDTLNDVNATCYRAQSFSTARSLAKLLAIPQEKYTVAFQSRLGKTPWIKPYSDEVIIERARKGDKKILAFAPAFVSDCLETIYEIGTEYDELFKSNGGEKIQMVDSLNDSPAWIKAMKNIIAGE